MNMHTVKLLWLWCLLATSWGGEVRLSTRQEIRDHLLSTARAAANNYADIRDELVVRERREREDTITETVQLLRADGTRSFDFGDTAVGYQVVVQHNGSLILADSDEVLVARTGEEFHIDDEIFEQVFPGFDQEPQKLTADNTNSDSNNNNDNGGNTDGITDNPDNSSVGNNTLSQNSSGTLIKDALKIIIYAAISIIFIL